MATATAEKPVKKAAPTTPKATRGEEKSPASSSAAFAVILTGGKQYRVKVGDRLRVEKIAGDHKEGEKITFDKVLLTEDHKGGINLGTPYIKGGEVKATLNTIGRAKKIEVIKYKQKSRYFKRYGHRQPYFEVIIDAIK